MCLGLWTPWTVACQATLAMEFSRQEYWSRLPRPPPQALSDPGIKPMSLVSPTLVGGFFITSATLYRNETRASPCPQELIVFVGKTDFYNSVWNTLCKNKPRKNWEHFEVKKGFTGWRECDPKMRCGWERRVMGVRRGGGNGKCSSHGDGTLIRKAWGQQGLGFFEKL